MNAQAREPTSAKWRLVRRGLTAPPEWTANAGIFYEYPGDVLGGRLSFNSDLRYTSRWLQGSFYIDGKTTVDANIGLKRIGGTGFDASIAVINLFNEKYDYGSFGSSAALGYKTAAARRH